MHLPQLVYVCVSKVGKGQKSYNSCGTNLVASSGDSSFQLVNNGDKDKSWSSSGNLAGSYGGLRR